MRQLRRSKHITPEEFAAAPDASDVNVSRIERADEPQIDTLRRFVEALGGKLIVQAHIDGKTIDLLAEE